MAEMIRRFGIPGILDIFPKGTIVQVIIDPYKYVYYEQLSSDENNPVWEKKE